MQLAYRLLALLQLHLHSRPNTWLKWIGQRQLQDKVRNIYVFGFGAPYIRGLTVYVWVSTKETQEEQMRRNSIAFTLELRLICTSWVSNCLFVQCIFLPAIKSVCLPTVCVQVAAGHQSDPLRGDPIVSVTPPGGVCPGGRLLGHVGQPHQPN